jgi:hypothetical protein
VPTPNYHAGLAPGLAALFKTVPYYHPWFRFYQFWTSVEGRREFAAVDPGWHGPGAVSAKNQQLRETLTRHLVAEYEGRPDLQRLMNPRYPPYGKRMLRDIGVWACALKQPNVTVVGEAIERITRAGVVTADGTEHPDLEGDDAQTGPQLGGVVPVDVAVTRDTHRAIRKPLLKLRQAEHDHGPLPVEQRRQLGRLLSGMALAVLLTSGRTATARRFAPAHQCRTRCAWYRAKSRSCINFPGGQTK